MSRHRPAGIVGTAAVSAMGLLAYHRPKTLAVRVGPGRLIVAHDDALGRDRTWAEGEVIDLVRGEARKLIASGDVEECA